MSLKFSQSRSSHEGDNVWAAAGVMGSWLGADNNTKHARLGKRIVQGIQRRIGPTVPDQSEIFLGVRSNGQRDSGRLSSCGHV